MGAEMLGDVIVYQAYSVLIYTLDSFNFINI